MSVITNPATAFPLADRTRTFPGMSLRDWFAGQALPQSIEDYGQPLISTNQGQRLNKGNPVLRYSNERSTREEIIALQAYCYADAMLAAREVKP